MDNDSFKELREQAKDLKRDELMSSWWVLRASLLTAVWIALLASGNIWLIVLGSFLHFPVSFNWVSLLHEAGHGNLFRKRWMNTTVGVLASWGSIMPYEQWRIIHMLHHRWTGYIDKDPTASGSNDTVIQDNQKKIVDFAWKYWIPIFVPAFYVRTFWNPFFSLQFAKNNRQKAFQIFCLAFTFLPYVTLMYLYGWTFILTFVPGQLITLWISDPLLLSQHVYMPRIFASDSEDKDVKPIHVRVQDQYTREVIFPRFISDYMLMNFNYHVVHHYFPNVPAYHLPRFEYVIPSRLPYMEWVRRSKRVPGHILLSESGDF